MRKTVQEAEARVKDLSVERDRVREEIDALIAETKVTDNAAGVEIDPVGTMRRVEERSMEIISDAEAAADAIRERAESEVLAAQGGIGEAHRRLQRSLATPRSASKRCLSWPRRLQTSR